VIFLKKKKERQGKTKKVREREKKERKKQELISKSQRNQSIQLNNPKSQKAASSSFLWPPWNGKNLHHFSFVQRAFWVSFSLKSPNNLSFNLDV